MSNSKPITFLVPGHPQPLEGTPAGAPTRSGGEMAAPLLTPRPLTRGTVKQSVQVGLQRDAGTETRVVAVPDEDVVVLHVAGGPALVLHPETARDLMLSQGDTKRSRGGEQAEGPDAVRVPARLRWKELEEGVPSRGATRGFLGDVLVSAVEVVTGLGKDKLADYSAEQLAAIVDGQVDEGIYKLDADELGPLKGRNTAIKSVAAREGGRPQLVLIHGTFSNASGTFNKLWTQHPQHVRSLFQQYGNEIYALDHATLGRSPIENALTLARALPSKARLHLLTHSRGGLVAEVLARVCAQPELSDEYFEPFSKKGYEPQLAALKDLSALVKEKDVQTERIVRVACPARGTLLASKRLDAYVSVLKWALELAGVPVAPAILDFLGEVARRRADPEILPGLAAQIPDSPLVKWLHSVDEPIAGDLRVLAGDLEGDSVVSWLKTLLADSFYWTDNDLVVQTRSMYGGTPRAGGATFLLDQGGKVSHFSYFSNERSAEAIVTALMQDTPAGFQTIGPLSWAGESSTGVRARIMEVETAETLAAKPAVFLLPGILGSNLKVKGKRIWLGWRIVNGLDRLAYDPVKASEVEPDGPIGMFYDDLAGFLSATHEVIEFPYDWRRPIEEEARRLATAVENALAARAKSGQPVRMMVHSMGGVVARVMQLERPQTWDRMMAHAAARLVMLGTPNGGSFAPMQVLSGDDTFGQWLVAFGAPFQDAQARELLAKFPGFLQLQADLLDEGLGLARQQTWQKLADEDLKRLEERSWWHRLELQIRSHAWGIPPQDVLDQSVALRKRLDEQLKKDFAKSSEKILLVVGKAKFTPVGYEFGDEGLVYLNAPENGDGRVALRSAMLPGVRTWALDCEHGSLPSKKEAFPAFLELLERGETTQLARVTAPVLAGATRGAATAVLGLVRSRPSRERLAAKPPRNERDLLSPEGPVPVSPRMAAKSLRITVTNGNLKFVREPLLLGHYHSMRLTGTEAVMDRLIGGAMSQSLKLGRYPNVPTMHQVFVNRTVNPDNPLQQLPRPEAVIVVGLGDEGKLRPLQLASTVLHGVLAWSQRVAEKRENTALQFELAATLIGSGGTGISAGQAAQLVAQGVLEANVRLEQANWPTVSHLHLIEVYLDRATEAWRALQLQSTSAPGQFNVTPTIQCGRGGMRRPLDSGYRGANYDFITAVGQAGENNDREIFYTVDSKRARTEVRAQATQTQLLRELVLKASNDRNDDPQIGHTLFRLLVPIEMEPYLSGSSELLLELDSETAGIPWELLDAVAANGASENDPWAIRSKLLRKLRTDDYRAQVVDATADGDILIIGEPACNPACYPRLPGARREANAVIKCLSDSASGSSVRVKSLVGKSGSDGIGDDALTIVNTLLERKRTWRIIHIAGHGEPPLKTDPRGVVLSTGFLGPREIRSLRTVPELVFVNCCHLAARDIEQVLGGSEYGRFNRPQFAAGVAQELIKIGVRCVIAAGWAVQDEAAMIFATTFYTQLLGGDRFMDAVTAARTKSREAGGNTWAAYQCYGDPDWTFRREGGDAQAPSESFTHKYDGVASARSLILALDAIAVRSQFDQANSEQQRTEIRHLEARFSDLARGNGEVAEAFGKAWAESGDRVAAIGWYDRAVAANDGSASFKASEQLSNLRVRGAWETVAKKLEARDKLEQSSKSASRRGKGRVRAKSDELKSDELVSAERDLVEAAKKARTSIRDGMDLLEKVTSLQSTMERENLLGSAFKRLAMVEAAAGNAREETKALESMRKHYAAAEQLARDQQLPDIYYPIMNRMAGDLAIEAGKGDWKGFDPADLSAARQTLEEKNRADADFWSVVGSIELRWYEALADRSLARHLDSIEQDFQQLHTRVSASRFWRSVADQMQFVLPKYARRASAPEKKAAESLLDFIETLTAGNTARA